MRNWICEYTSLAVHTILIEADTRKEAEEKFRRLRDGDGAVEYEPLDTEYRRRGTGRVVKEAP